MVNVNDPEIRDRYEEVRSDSKDTNWVLLQYEGNDKLVVGGSGSGGAHGLSELKTHLKDDQASFAYVRVKYANDTESTREKFVLITWIGESAGVMRKARVSVHRADVKEVLRSYSLEVTATSLEELDEGQLVVRLRKAGGASYDKA